MTFTLRTGTDAARSSEVAGSRGISGASIEYQNSAGSPGRETFAAFGACRAARDKSAWLRYYECNFGARNKD